jgi:hypothetical protein
MAAKIIGILAIVVAIMALNYIGVPGYVVALVIAFIRGYSLLRENQAGKTREKLALLAAFVVSIFAYSLISGQDYGAYVGAVVFLASGFGLTRLYKTRVDWHLWFMELLPSVLHFLLLERVGGAVSGLGYIIPTPVIEIPVRYIEALLLLIAFCICQGKITVYKTLASAGTYGQREYAPPRLRALKSFGRFVAVATLVIIWFNPFNVLVVDNIKNSILDSLANIGFGDSTVTTISESNSTTLLSVKSDAPITNDSAALELLSSYDKELGGDFMLTKSEKLPSGNTVYSFAQTSNGVPIYGSGKKLVVGADNQPMYIAGTAKLGVETLSAPNSSMQDSQARQLVNDTFAADGVTIGDAAKAWYLSPDDGSIYMLAYSVPVASDYGNGIVVSCDVLMDSVSGEIIDVSGFSTSDHSGDNLSTILDAIKENGNFNDADLESIIQSADTIVSGVNSTVWVYRDILIEECQRYYDSKGDANLGKDNVNTIKNAFKDAGVSENNKDEGVVQIDLQSSRASVKGMVNCPYDTDEILINHNNMTTQQYTFKSSLPVTLTVSKRNGEVVLTLPVFDEESFEIYPTGGDEEYIVSILGGSDYQEASESTATPLIANTLSIQPMAVASMMNWFSNAEQASYELSVRQLKSDPRIPNSEGIFGMLDKIESTFNSGNGSRFLSLYRFDELSAMFHDAYYDDFVNTYGQGYADIIDSSISSNALSIYTQMFLVYYRTYNTVFKGLAEQYSEVQDLSKAVSDNPDKTAIAFVLFGFQGTPEHWSSNFTEKMLHLNNSTLSLAYLGQEKKDNKTFVKAAASIKQNGSIIIDDTITIVIQHFGNAQTISSDGSGNWLSNFIDGIGDYLTSGDYLGLDLSGIVIPDWIPDYDWGRDDEEENENEDSSFSSSIRLKAAALSALSYNDFWVETQNGTDVDSFGRIHNNKSKDYGQVWNNDIWDNMDAKYGGFFSQTVGKIKMLCNAGDIVNKGNGIFAHKEPGFFGIAFYDETSKTVFVVYRGTDKILGTDGFDFNGEDMQYSASQFVRARGFYWNLVVPAIRDGGLNGYEVVFCGHSLGGALADSMSMQTGLPSISINGSTGRIISNVYVLDPYFSAAWPNFNGVDKWNFSNYITEKEPLLSGPGSNYWIAHQNITAYNNHIVNYNGYKAIKSLGSGYHDVLSQIKYSKRTFVNCGIQLTHRPNKAKELITFIPLSVHSNVVEKVGIIFGTSGPDSISTKSRFIYGGNGDDTMHGLSKASTFVGGYGTDTFYAAVGNKDMYGDRYFIYKGQGVDTIYDTGGEDVIILAGYDSNSDFLVDSATYDSKENNIYFSTITCNGQPIVRLAAQRIKTGASQGDPIQLIIQYTDGSSETRQWNPILK